MGGEYNFPAKAPFAGSVAEQRLKESCDKYAGIIDHTDNIIPGSLDKKKVSSSDVERRNLHNQIAVMVVGRQRSGMDEDLARQIADFAYEYSRGYKVEEAHKYK